jgi:uridine phosphorylase
MESAALFVVATVRGVAAGAICLVAGAADGRRLDTDQSRAGIEAAIGVALDAVTRP